MCGICGALGGTIDEATLHAATDLLTHRGPDEDGYLFTPPVALGMRRLSIIDLSGGSQPKCDESGHIQVIFNGEIYNYRELQHELEAAGHIFRSHSDTEVIAHGYEAWEYDCFRRLNGIFAIAVWDGRRGELVLARDHLGVKPLYWTERGGEMLFGSELKPILRMLPAMPAIDPISAMLYLRYGYVPAPRSIFAGTYKLPPAHYLVASPDRSDRRIVRYWDPLVEAEHTRTGISVEEAEDLVDEALGQAVRRQLVSDVPLGAFLSGGIDSSLVVAAMQHASDRPTETFSIGFREAREDESAYARAVAEHLGTAHHEWIITDEHAQEVAPKLPYYFDEPFADSSAVPTYLVSELARRHVTVSLSGDGGDELFGGYTRYSVIPPVRRAWMLPAQLRQLGVDAGERLPGSLGAKFRSAGSVVAASSLSDAYRNLIATTKDRALTRLTPTLPEALRTNPEWPAEIFAGKDLLEAMMLVDLVTYLPDDILTKVDRASMAHSLEARVPLLDPRFVELALSLPVSVRCGGGPKSLLRSVLKRSIPAALVDRPKHGFGIPQDAWLRGGLRDCMVDHLSGSALAAHGLFDAAVVQALMRDHLTGAGNNGNILWAMLMFQMWYRRFFVEAPLGSLTSTERPALSPSRNP